MDQTSIDVAEALTKALAEIKTTSGEYTAYLTMMKTKKIEDFDKHVAEIEAKHLEVVAKLMKIKPTFK